MGSVYIRRKVYFRIFIHLQSINEVIIYIYTSLDQVAHVDVAGVSLHYRKSVREVVCCYALCVRVMS